MPGTAGPNFGIVMGHDAREFYKVDEDLNRFLLDAFLTIFAVTGSDFELNTPPGSPANGRRVIVGNAGSGDFSGHNFDYAIYWTAKPGGAGWIFRDPKDGDVCLRDYTGTARLMFFVSGGWSQLPGT